MAVLEAGAARERDRVAGGLRRHGPLARRLRAAHRTRALDVRWCGRRRVVGGRVNRRLAGLDDRRHKAGRGVTTRVTQWWRVSVLFCAKGRIASRRPSGHDVAHGRIRVCEGTPTAGAETARQSALGAPTSE